MLKIENNKKYDLEERTLLFAKKIISLVKSLPYDEVNKVLGIQATRSGTSIGANYREVNETQTKKDFCFRIRICRKESKETIYWLTLIREVYPPFMIRCDKLIDECQQL